jgi:hypothetical protein
MPYLHHPAPWLPSLAASVASLCLLLREIRERGQDKEAGLSEPALSAPPILNIEVEFIDVWVMAHEDSSSRWILCYRLLVEAGF